MIQRLTIALLCALALLAGNPAMAAEMAVKAATAAANAPVPFALRWYVEGRLGGPLIKTYDIDIGGIGAATYKASDGFHGAADIGIAFTPNWRVEVEFTWTRGRDGNVVIDTLDFPHTGRTDVQTFNVNGFYTFDLPLPVKPYIGAGVGRARYKVNNLGAVGGTFVIDDSDSTTVYAFHAGIDVPITRSLVLTGRYSYAHTGAMTFESEPAGNPTTRRATWDNVFSGGLRVYLN